MTNNNHPITPPLTPPPELVEQWDSECESDVDAAMYLATQAARWGADQQLKLDAERINQAWQRGADQELEACCEWIYKLMDRGLEWSMDLRAARRPKPPTLKEQALQALDLLKVDASTHGLGFDSSAIRRALESLPE